MSRPLSPTKIVCTLGPATRSAEKIRELMDAELNVARLNFSHGTHNENEHKQSIRWLRNLAREQRIPVAVLADLQGPKIRTGPLEANRPVHIHARNYYPPSERNRGVHLHQFYRAAPARCSRGIRFSFLTN